MNNWVILVHPINEFSQSCKGVSISALVADISEMPSFSSFSSSYYLNIIKYNNAALTGKNGDEHNYIFQCD